jgi:hypothetical protein
LSHGRVKQRAKGDFDRDIALQLVVHGTTDGTEASFSVSGYNAMATEGFRRLVLILGSGRVVVWFCRGWLCSSLNGRIIVAWMLGYKMNRPRLMITFDRIKYRLI